jgi:hypothetical protein
MQINDAMGGALDLTTVDFSALNAPDTLYEKIGGNWVQGTDATHDSIADCLAWLNGNPPTAGIRDYATGHGGQSWKLDGKAVTGGTPLAGRIFAIKPKANCSVAPQTLGTGTQAGTNDTTYANIKGTSGSPLNITLESESGSLTVSLSAAGSLLTVADSAAVNVTVQNLTLKGIGMPSSASNNSAPLVVVGSGDTFTLGSGGVLTGNVNYSATEGTDGNAGFLAGHGGAVYVKGSNANLVLKQGGVIEGNTATFKGGGVYLETGAALTNLTNNGTIYDNGNTDPGTHTDYTALPGDQCNVAPQGADLWFNEPNLSIKFGKATVADTFNAVHDYINNTIAGYSKFTSATTGSRSVGVSNSVIHLGDYIDLPSLQVAAYYTGSAASGGDANNGKIDLTNTSIVPDYAGMTWADTAQLSNYKAEYEGALLRLIVVGVNSFVGKNGIGSTPHIVFQFQNLPGVHRMKAGVYNNGGYMKSEIRAYLVPVDSSYHSSSESNFGTAKTGSGAYLKGLEDAGVPVDLLWPPKQVVSHGGSSFMYTDTLEDKLWLPTENEMNGYAADAWYYWSSGQYSSYPYSETAERGSSQPVLEYYTESADYKVRQMRRLKYKSTGASDGWRYCESSPRANTSLLWCEVYLKGMSFSHDTGLVGDGVAPAFCVK